jgi:ATP-dependent DNA helicase RecG
MRQLPAQRPPITTFWFDESKRQFVYTFIREEIGKGRQVYIVYPRILKKEGSNIKSAAAMYNELQDKAFPDLKLALIHGRMPSKDKEMIMKKFKEGGYHILVSTVVIEVGIDIPNASLMVVENAERFGLAQLHQLRGRIGRGVFQSYCILLGSAATETAQRRLSKMTETQDGFEISEEDLQLRGPGEFLGTRQHGIPELKIGNIVKDFEIMEDARKEAFALVSQDPTLSDPRNYMIKQRLLERYEDYWREI